MMWHLLRLQFSDARPRLFAVFAAMTMAIAPDFGFWTSIAFVALIPMLGSARVSPLEMVLPVHARTILLSRLLATTSLVFFPVATWVVAMQIRGVPQWSHSLVATIVASAVLATAAPNLFRMRDAAAVSKALIAAVWGGTALVVFLVASLLSDVAALVVTCTALAVTLVVLWKLAPESYLLVPERQSTNLSVQLPVIHAGAGIPGGSTAWWRPVLREVFTPHALLFLALLSLFGVIGRMLAIYLFMFVLVFMDVGRRRLAWLHVFPFSHRRRFFLLAGGYVMLLMAAIGVGAVVGAPFWPGSNSMGVGAPSVSDDYDRMESRAAVPTTFWKLAPRGKAPVVQSPWGETSPVYSLDILRWTLYNPYSFVEANSERFIDWQFARATTAVYGRAIPRSAYDDERRGLPAHVTSSPRMLVLSGAVLAVYALLIVFVRELARMREVRAHRLLRHLPVALGLMLFAALLGVDFLSTGYVNDFTVSRVQALLLDLSAALPSSLAVVVVFAAIPVAAAYLLAEWQFSRSDYVGADVKPMRGG